MEKAILLHNPGAGDEDHLKSDLIQAIEAAGFGCVYFSIKKEDGWKQQLDLADFAVVAGGDGTVRCVVKELIKKNVQRKKLPIAILPMGTANNLSNMLGLNSDLDYRSHIKSWHRNKQQRFDIGVIQNVDTTDFFLESVGYGAFPNLIQRMETIDKRNVETAKDELRIAHEVLQQIVLSAEAERYRMKADDKIYEGKALLLEAMNIRSIGPNLVLAPDAQTDDGLFDIVYVEEEQREELAEHIGRLIDDENSTFNWKIIKAKELTIDCDSKHMHVDDELIPPLKNPLVLKVRENLLEFLV